MEGLQMSRLLLSDDHWELIADVFPEPAKTGRPLRDRRTIIDGILWILRTGAAWRDLPEDEFGPWETVYRLFDQWNSDGTLDEILSRLIAEKVVQERLIKSCGVSMARASEPPAAPEAEEKKRSRGTG
jgi:transposase